MATEKQVQYIRALLDELPPEWWSKQVSEEALPFHRNNIREYIAGVLHIPLGRMDTREASRWIDTLKQGGLYVDGGYNFVPLPEE